MVDWYCPINSNHDCRCHRDKNHDMVCDICGSKMICQDDVELMSDEYE